MSDTDHRVVCSCGAGYPIVDGVIDMAPPQQDYFFSLQSVSAQQFRELLEEIRTRGWDTAYASYLRRYFASRPRRRDLKARVRDTMLGLRGRAVAGVVRAIQCRSQAYHWLLTSLPRDGAVLDLGAGWSAMSHVLAEECREVVAADVTLERLQFSALRAQHHGMKNMRFVRTSVRLPLPFADASFDLVVINGVLEWVAASTDGEPESVQRDYLREVHRILKPTGQVIIGIENRFGFSDLLGFPEGHVGLPFVGVVPRRVGDLMTRTARRGPMRVATHSAGGLTRLLEHAAFNREHIATFAPQPTYSWYDTIGAVDDRAATRVARATLFDHPAFRKRAGWVPTALRRASTSVVGAFYTIASKAPRQTILEELRDSLIEQGIPLQFPFSTLRVREHKVCGRAELDTGSHVHFAIGMSSLGNARVEREYRALELLAREGVRRQVHTPVPLLRSTFRGHAITVFQEAPGAPLRESSVESADWRMSSAALEHVEAVAGALSGLEPSRTVAEVWSDRWNKLLPLLWDDERAQSARRLERAMRPAGELGQAVAAIGHRDLLAGNVLHDRSSGTLAVIDWESAGHVYPQEDAATVLISHARARYGSFGGAVVGLLDVDHGQPPSWLQPLADRTLRDPHDFMRALVMAWISHVSHAEQSFVLSDAEWLRDRVWSVIDALSRAVPVTEAAVLRHSV